jgi:hypothetical protein
MDGSRNQKRVPIIPVLLFALMGIVAYVAQGLNAIDASSQTFDEAVHLAAGYSYWKTGDFRLNVEDPPLSKLIQSFPLLFLDLPFDPDPQLWQRADEWLIGKWFLYESPVPAWKLLACSRIANLFLGVCLLLLIGRWVYRTGVVGPGYLLFFMLVASDQNLVAIGSQLSSDMALAFFSTLTFYCLWEYQRSYRRGWLVALGISVGLTLGSKFSALFVVCALVGTVVLRYWFGGVRFALPDAIGAGSDSDGRPESLATPSRPGGGLGEMLPAFVRVMLIALLTLLPLYFFVGFPSWGQGLKQQFMRNAFESPKYFFLGEVTSDGSLWYFPFVFLVKTPTGTLVWLAVWSVLSIRWYRIESGSLLLPAGLFFLVIMLTKVNLGVRVILPVYPLLYVWGGAYVASWERHRFRVWEGYSKESPAPWWKEVPLLIPFFLTFAAFVLNTKKKDDESSNPLTYFNRFAGGWQNGHKLLGDSNLDWGQDLWELRDWLKTQGDPMIYLSYAGTAPPREYGIRYQLLPSWGYLEAPEDRVPADQPRHIVAVSITNLQGTYLKDRDTFAFLRDREPTAIVGQTIWIFDLTDEPELLKRVREMGR